jgi:hypothetical protein
MAKSKATPLNSGLLVRKGEASPSSNAPKASSTTESPLPQGTKDTVAVTVRLDQERYHRLVGYSAHFTPWRTNQEILVAALDAYLAALTVVFHTRNRRAAATSPPQASR